MRPMRSISASIRSPGFTGATPAGPYERAIGWTAHYFIGITFAAVLLAVWGVEWARQPTLAPALIVGIWLSPIWTFRRGI